MLIYIRSQCILQEKTIKYGVKMRNFRNSAYASFLRPDKSPPNMRKLYVRSVGYAHADRNFYEKPRRITYGAIYWCCEGSSLYMLDSKEHILNPGEVWFYPPGALVNFHPLEKGMRFYWMALYGDVLLPLFDALDIRAGKTVCGAPPDELFQELISKVRISKPEQRIDVLHVAMEIIFKIASPNIEVPCSSMQALAQEARSIIEKEFSSNDFKVARLAYALGIHPVTLCKEFKKEFQITPQNFLTDCRVRHAMELLESHKYLVKEVANMCGFSSSEYFSTVFSAKFGYSPSQFLLDTAKKR